MVKRIICKILAMTFLLSLFNASSEAFNMKRKPLSGSMNKTISSPSGRRSATFQGNRNVKVTPKGTNAESDFSVTGSKGKTVSGTSNSTVSGNSAAGEAAITGPKGGVTNMSGKATKEGDTITGSGTIAGPKGKTVTGDGSVTKEGNTYSGIGTVTGPKGKTVTSEGSISKDGDTYSGKNTVTGPGGNNATLSGSGNKTSGSATIDTKRGTSEADWNEENVSVTSSKGKTKTFNRKK